MSKFKSLKRILTNRNLAKALIISKLRFLFTDEQYLKLIFPLSLGYPLNLEDPKTYNEKLQWLKLYNKNPLYTTLVDKYAVKEWVAKKIGSQYVIPTLGVWDDARKIDFDALPEQFVLKATHDGGGASVIVCKSKQTFDKGKAIKQLNRCLRRKHSKSGLEWVYDDVPPRIIAEQYMEDSTTGELRDYKFFAFDGYVPALFVATERGSGHVKFDYFDSDFKHLDLTQSHPNATFTINKPETFEEMKRIASVLSKGIPHVRVDLYEVNGKVYFGEMTFFHYGGHTPFNPVSWDRTFGDWITLPQKNAFISV